MHTTCLRKGGKEERYGPDELLRNGNAADKPSISLLLHSGKEILATLAAGKSCSASVNADPALLEAESEEIKLSTNRKSMKKISGGAYEEMKWRSWSLHKETVLGRRIIVCVCVKCYVWLGIRIGI